MTNYQQRMADQARQAAALAAKDNTEDLRQAVQWLLAADQVVIGGAAGLSAAGGMDYMAPQTLQRQFPALAARGYRTLWQALWDPQRTETQKWAMLAAEALWSRFGYPVIPAYRDLLDLVAGKDYFVLTSNIDDQFIKAGFSEDRVFAPQGSIAHFQCSVPCCRRIWDGEADYRRIAAHTDPAAFACREEDLPRCPHCGAPAIQNARGPVAFIPDEVMRNRAPFEAFMARAAAGRTVFLELGVGYNSPGMIRHPFQRLTWLWPGARLIRMNRDHPAVPEKIAHKSIAIGGDLADALYRMKALRAAAL